MFFNKQNITLHRLHVHDDARFLVGFLRCCYTTKAYRDLEQFELGTFFFTYSLHADLQSGPDQGTFGRTRGLQTQSLLPTSNLANTWGCEAAA